VATVRPEVVEGIVNAYARRDESALAEALRQANDVERRYIADLLADDAIAHLRATGYLRDDSLLGMRRDQLVHLGCRATPSCGSSTGFPTGPLIPSARSGTSSR
jgi:hypothetical protein